VSEINAVTNLDAPVLCFDTCSILDILRDITRPSTVAEEHYAALRIVAALESGSVLRGLVARKVHSEFHDNLDRVCAEALTKLNQFRQQMIRIDALVGVFGQAIRTDLSHLDGHVDRCRGVVDRLMAAAAILPQEPDIIDLANARMHNARTPARKGKGSWGDCVVIETYLRAASELRANGLAAKIVFVSSNTRDYADETGSALRPDLAQEFAVLGMEYAPNLAAARYFVGL